MHVKEFRINPQIGTARHSVSYHDGVSTHRDGSAFWGLNILRTSRKLAQFVAKLKREGYREQR